MFCLSEERGTILEGVMYKQIDSVRVLWRKDEKNLIKEWKEHENFRVLFCLLIANVPFVSWVSEWFDLAQETFKSN